MGTFDPVKLYVAASMKPSSTLVKEKTFMYGVWHIHNFGHWVHDNMMALYATMMQHGGVDRNNRIVAFAVHEWNKPIRHSSPYEANEAFMRSLEVFTKHPVTVLTDYDTKGPTSM